MRKKCVIVFIFVALIATAWITWSKRQYFFQNEKNGTICKLPRMLIKRSAHSATLLDDGRVLLCGGIVEVRGEEVNTETTEFFNPLTNDFAKGPSMIKRRAGHTATLIGDSLILISGGFNEDGFLNHAELLNLKSGKFESINGMMTEKRASHTATQIEKGLVVIIGGVNGGTNANKTIDIFNPVTKKFSKAGELLTSRTGHTTSLLPDGRLLTIGGSKNWRDQVLNTCETFDPKTNRVESGASLNDPRNKHSAVSLLNGDILVIGGSDDASRIGGRYSSCELFDHETNKFVLLNDQLNLSRFKITNGGSLLHNGNIIIAGDGKYAEIYNINSKKFYIAKGDLADAWMYPSVTTLKDGRVLIAGGYNSGMQATSGAWIYQQ